MSFAGACPSDRDDNRRPTVQGQSATVHVKEHCISNPNGSLRRGRVIVTNADKCSFKSGI